MEKCLEILSHWVKHKEVVYLCGVYANLPFVGFGRSDDWHWGGAEEVFKAGFDVAIVFRTVTSSFSTPLLVEFQRLEMTPFAFYDAVQ